MHEEHPRFNIDRPQKIELPYVRELKSYIEDDFSFFANSGLIKSLEEDRQVDMQELKEPEQLLSDFVEFKDGDGDIETGDRLLSNWETKCRIYLAGLQGKTAFKLYQLIYVVEAAILTFDTNTNGILDPRVEPVMNRFRLSPDDMSYKMTGPEVIRKASQLLAKYYAQVSGINEEQLEEEFWNLCGQNRRIEAYIKQDYTGGFVESDFFAGFE